MLHHKNIESFTPALPPSSIFYDPKYLASFLMLKCKCQLHKKISIHVEFVNSNKCGKCSSKINKARVNLFSNLMDMADEISHAAKSLNRLDQRRSFIGNTCPKSLNTTHYQTLHNSHSEPMNEQRHCSSHLIPSISKSNVLRDFKSLVRRKSTHYGRFSMHSPQK